MGDIKIQGAGPAGLTAAIKLASEGFGVTVFEKNDECGMRFRGDFQGLENWSSEIDILDDLRSMDIDINFWNKPIFSCEFYDYRLERRLIEFEKPGLYLVKRGIVQGSLDLALREQALKYGAKIRFKNKASDDTVDIIASGPRHVDGIVRGMTFDTQTEHVPIIILDDNLAPKSFAYLLTSDGRGCLGTGLSSMYQRADEFFKRTLSTFQKIIDLDISHSCMFTGYGNFFTMDQYQKNGQLYVGEAAGLQDFLFAFGLRQAITSGYLAAVAISEQKSYDKLLKERFYSQLKVSLSNRFLFSLLGNRGYSVFLKRGKTIGDPLKKMFTQYNSSLLKKVSYPFAKVVMRK
ncbi:MAG: NAD(P)/FAD-dependent oxidoreductase [Candidatus Thermoplasmatota archaeon]|nr:NAD(P)/FAD-dependent oxidoreductase [Candidatus Thermoplasmatota archaeon]